VCQADSVLYRLDIDDFQSQFNYHDPINDVLCKNIDQTGNMATNCSTKKHVTSISIVSFNVLCKNTDQNSMPVWQKNSKSVLIPCFVPNHIKYTDNGFGAKTLAELCLRETNVFPDVSTLTIDECLQ